MAILYGSGSGSITSTAYNICGTLKTICLWNKTGSTAIIGVGIVVSGINTFLFSATLAAHGSADSSVYQKTNIVVKAGWQIIISANNPIDYYLLIE